MRTRDPSLLLGLLDLLVQLLLLLLVRTPFLQRVNGRHG